ncbi:hypothetical protein H0H92_005376 [Tricholoma furcatifolium]|nr:hypothetical protein H0H92_005376 [Tricholoma furcatifolium]
MSKQVSSRKGALRSDTPTSAHYSAYDAMAEEGQRVNFLESELHHKRGNYPAVNVGVTMGLGATYPTNLSTGSHSQMMNRLLANRDIIRMANFADTAFNFWAPNVYEKYRTTLLPLFDSYHHLKHIFERSIYPAAAYNFGPNVFTLTHCDCMNNLADGAQFRPWGDSILRRGGGHLVLPGLNLVIKFPAGALILIPSATITHRNIPVQESDECASLTQYCAGGLFRYVENGYHTDNELKKLNSLRDTVLYDGLISGECKWVAMSADEKKKHKEKKNRDDASGETITKNEKEVFRRWYQARTTNIDGQQSEMKAEGRKQWKWE